MRTTVFLVCLGLLLSFAAADAQERKEKIPKIDSIANKDRIAKAEEFYDILKIKTGKSRFSRLLYKTMIVDHPDSSAHKRLSLKERSRGLIDDVTYYEQFAGIPIAHIYIETRNIFDSEHPNNLLERNANKLHRITRNRTVRKSLLFEVGQTLDPLILSNNEYYLRQLPYMADATIVVQPSAASPDSVDVYVITQDNWSISADLRAKSGRKYFLELYDDNLLGYGNKLSIRTYLRAGSSVYAGNQVEYNIPNFLGSFYNVNLLGGKGFDDYIYRITLNKEFLIPNDYGLGASVSQTKSQHRLITEIDSSYQINYRDFNLWGGKSFAIGALRNQSIFVTGRLFGIDYKRRPYADLHTNTAFWDKSVGLLSVGIYKEHFYRGNFIYGYGRSEDIPYGYKFEATGGYAWGEFKNHTILQLTASAGGKLGLGYLHGSAAAETLLPSGGKGLGPSVVNANISGFSGLLTVGKSSFLRQFFDINLTMGFNRLAGEGERLGFHDRLTPRGLRTKNLHGLNRFVSRNETVLFTPLFLYGFRFAFFGFYDMAWLGDHSALFQNQFFTTIGLGIRLKNEHLIFNTIELRFGFALNRNGFYDYDYVNISNEQRLRVNHYKPTQPNLLGYE